MVKKGFFWGMVVMALTFGLVLARCGDSSSGDPSSPNTDTGNNGDNSGNNSDDNDGGNNSGGNKTFTFTVKNELGDTYAKDKIFRIQVQGGIDKTGLSIPSGSSSSSLSHTVSDGYQNFHIYVYYDSSYPTIRASYDVDVNNDPTSFTLELYNQGSTVKLER
jgi:hypothetical protein